MSRDVRRPAAELVDNRRSNWVAVGQLPAVGQTVDLDFSDVLPALQHQRWLLSGVQLRSRGNSDLPRVVEYTIRVGPYTTETRAVTPLEPDTINRVLPEGWSGIVQLTPSAIYPSGAATQVWVKVEQVSCTTLSAIR